jgi:predicted nuclease of predicted toxin-antitoxin system
MRLKLDENIPASLVGDLVALGHDADTVVQEGLQGRSDPDVFAAAQREQRFFVTQDLDFSDLRRFEPGTHHGLLLVRLGSPGRAALATRLRGIFAREEVGAWSGGFIVATDRKLRVRLPKK